MATVGVIRKNPEPPPIQEIVIKLKPEELFSFRYVLKEYINQHGPGTSKDIATEILKGLPT